MGKERTKKPPLLDWGVARRAKPGEAACGDDYVAQLLPGGALVGVVDGLGAAEEAAATTRTAVATLKKYAKDPVTALVKRCDRNLMMTRGAALALAKFSAAESSLSWISIGNVEGWLVHANAAAKPPRETLRTQEGVVGYHVPIPRESSATLQPGDLLVIASDGVRHDFSASLAAGQPPQALAEEILERNFKGTDDAVVLVARYQKGV